MNDFGATSELPSRERAFALLREHTKKEGLIKHALAVEAAMRACARVRGGDPEAWGLVGLLHDLDYERWPSPTDHPYRGVEILKDEGYPSWFRRAVLSHAEYTGTTRESDLERALFACDELCGFLVACALVTADKSLESLQLASVKKKLKSKGFAAAVSREDISRGAAELGTDLEAHITLVLEALRGIAPELGLGGRAPSA